MIGHIVVCGSIVRVTFPRLEMDGMKGKKDFLRKDFTSFPWLESVSIENFIIFLIIIKEERNIQFEATGYAKNVKSSFS